MFDAEVSDVSEVSYSFDFPFDEAEWSVGVIVGPSGSGKSTVLRHVFGDPSEFEWTRKPIIDQFERSVDTAAIADAFQSVGFGTVPAWCRPYSVLSNGEKFRVEMARRILESTGQVLVDEFTSVVDRQVARSVSWAVQKHVRKKGIRLVAATCHYDVIDWLNPDWVLDMADCRFARRSLRRRPVIECRVEPIPRRHWSRFSRFHYLTARLPANDRCWGLWVRFEADDPWSLVGFTSVGNRPHAMKKNAYFSLSRIVVLPDYQGLGLAFAMIDQVARIYGSIGDVFVQPTHPGFIRSFTRSPRWSLERRSGRMQRRSSAKPGMTLRGGIPASVKYVGDVLPERESRHLIALARAVS